MTNNDHPSFIKPDEDTTIWHYMDFTKFASLLDKSALFFPTLGILRESDEHEGTYNHATIEASKLKPLSLHQIGSAMLQSFGRVLGANSWHMNEIESVAMWNVYLKGNPGVAIQSTVKSLAHELSRSDVQIGKVHYLNEDDVIPEPDGFNGLNAALWKWKSYQYENELRAVIISNLEDLHKYNGIYIPIDLKQLIRKIIIAPKTPKWVSELVFSLSAKYEISDRVVSSRLDVRPGSIDNNEFSIEITCPLCNTKQEIVLAPFFVKENFSSVVVYSADRATIQCQNCHMGLSFAIRPQMEYSTSDGSQTETG